MKNYVLILLLGFPALARSQTAVWEYYPGAIVYLNGFSDPYGDGYPVLYSPEQGSYTMDVEENHPWDGWQTSEKVQYDGTNAAYIRSWLGTMQQEHQGTIALFVPPDYFTEYPNGNITDGSGTLFDANFIPISWGNIPGQEYTGEMQDSGGGNNIEVPEGGDGSGNHIMHLAFDLEITDGLGKAVLAAIAIGFVIFAFRKLRAYYKSMS